MSHELKTINPYFEEVWQRRKNFEIRLNDRDFKEGDYLTLREYDPINETYSGRVVYATVSYVLSGFIGLSDGFVGLGLTGINRDVQP